MKNISKIMDLEKKIFQEEKNGIIKIQRQTMQKLFIT